MWLGSLGERRREPAECVIKVDSSLQEITELYPYLTEVVVRTDRKQAGVATLKFETRRDEHGHWIVQDAGVFAPWQPIVIEAAFGSYSEEVMRGYVREVNPDYPADPGATTVTVECQDESYALDREHIRREWGAEAPTSDAVILKKIAGDRHGLVVDPAGGPGLSNLVLLQDSTDIRFLRSRARANGYELIFREGRVYFGPPRLDAKPQDAILVYAGPDTHCVRLSVRDDGHRPERVAFEIADAVGSGSTEHVIAPDLALLGTESADSSGAGLAPFVWRMSRTDGRNEEELMALARGHANEQSMRVSAEGEVDGSLYGHVLRVAEPVGVDGLGERYGGVYYVDKVTHRFDTQGYRQSITLLRNAYGDNLAAVSNPLASLL